MKNSEFTNKKSRKRSTKTLGGCFTCLIGIMLVFGLPMLCGATNYVSHRLQFQRQRSQWINNRIDDYIITVESQGRISGQRIVITVLNSIVTQVNDSSLNQRTDTNEFYQRIVIDGLFNYAQNCWMICQVQYDSTYGFPNYIYGVIESSGYRVIGFEPITSSN